MSDHGLQRAPLVGGFYVARSGIANYQRCLNLYPEKNPDGSPCPYTDYPTPGLTMLGEAPLQDTVRGLYTATDGQLFAVVGQNLYAVNSAWEFTFVGTLALDVSTPVSMVDNGAALYVVDGSATGYVVDLGTLAFSTKTSVDNYLGADKVDYIDTFFLFNQPLTKNVYCSLSNSTSFDPTFIAGKTGRADQLATLVAMHREIWLLGSQRSSEVWFNAGGSGFPFNILPGVFIEEGCIAKYSACQYDLMVFWLGINAAGERTVFMGQQYAARRISTPAVAEKLRKMSTVSDAIGMMYQIQDHAFYVLTFPTADTTLVFDVSEGLWHEWASFDQDGLEHRHRANCTALAYDTVVCGDYANGLLYKLDFDSQTDNGQPIVRRRTFGHLVADGKRVSYEEFLADMEAGNAGNNVTDHVVFMRYSNDRGRTWSDPVAATLGEQGNFIARPTYWKQGMAYDMIFELFWSSPQFTALNGAFIDFTVAST